MATSTDPMSGPAGRPRRSYHSDLRTRQAERTRQLILEAAVEVFAERGYSGSSLAEIGRRAGVSTESVAANGPKRRLLMAAFELSLGGREGDDAVSQRPETLARLGSDDVHEVVTAMSELAVEAHGRSIGMWRALTSAAIDDPEVAELYAELSQRRRADNLAAVRMLADKGFTRTDRPQEELADTLALLAGFDPYQLMVREFGWSEEQLREWFERSIYDLLLDPRHRPPTA